MSIIAKVELILRTLHS